MRITLDARMMGPEHTRGIGRYVQELVHALVAVAPEHRYVLAVRNPETSPFVGNPSIEHVKADVPWYGLAEQTRMPRILADTRPDLVHVPHWNVAVASQLPRVVTLHDLILLSEPKSANITTRGPLVAGIKRMGYRFALDQAIRHSRRVLVPTAWVRDDVKKFFPSLATPIDVTGEGMPDPNPALWSDTDQTNPYLLYVGSAYPHKNLDALLDAWPEIRRRHPTLSLVLAGPADAFMHRLEERVARERLQGVRFPGRVSDAELSRLYAKALAFVFPSRAEGFGLPPLEALAHGCPVISARSSSLPEVLGTQGILFFEPGGGDGILRAIEAVFQDSVGVRTQARQAGVSLRARHDWRHAAERTLEAYRKVLDHRTDRTTGRTGYRNNSSI